MAGASGAAQSSQSSGQTEAPGSSSGTVARIQEPEVQEIEEVAVVKQEEAHFLAGEENYEENYDANYYDDPSMMEYDSSQNVINSKGEKNYRN